MQGILLTQADGIIMGPVSKLLGIIMNAIFNVLDFIGIPNIGLSIILFTIIIYLLMLPLTIKQQKFSKISAKLLLLIGCSKGNTSVICGRTRCANGSYVFLISLIISILENSGKIIIVLKLI